MRIRRPSSRGVAGHSRHGGGGHVAHSHVQLEGDRKNGAIVVSRARRVSTIRINSGLKDAVDDSRLPHSLQAALVATAVGRTRV